MSRSLVNKFLLCSISIGLLIGFQNCSPGFEVLSDLALTAEAARAPEVRLTAEVPELANLRSLSVAFDVTLSPGRELKSLTCQLNEDPPQDCMSGLSLVDLADGPYVLRINAEDSQGLKSEEIVRTFEVDATAPSVMASGLPPALNSLANVSIAFTAMDNRTPSSSLKFRCAFDKQPFADCASPVVLNEISIGEHLLQIDAIDEAGNTSAKFSYAWTMDPRVPSLTISDGPAALSNQTIAKFVFTGKDDGEPITNFQCKLDGGAYADCSSGSVTYTALAAGPHTFYLRGLDTDGVYSEPTKREWIIDRVAPEIPVVVATITEKFGQSPVARFMMTSTDNSGVAPTFECSLNSDVYESCSSPKEYPKIAGGTNTFRVAAIDAAGNKSAPKTYTWKTPLYITVPQANPAFQLLAASDIKDLAFSNGVLYVATNYGLSISTNGGSTYSTRTVQDGLSSNNISAVSANGSIVCVVANAGDVFLSRDGGKTFGPKLTMKAGGQLLSALSVHCDDKVIITNGNSGISISTDGGVAFETPSLPRGTSIGTQVSEFKFTEGILYLIRGTDLLVSKDFGKTFTIAKGLSGGSIYTLAASGNTAYVTAGTADSLYVSKDGGANFTLPDANFNGQRGVFRWGVGAIGANAIYAIMHIDLSERKYALVKSTDEGKTFTQVNDVFNTIEGIRYAHSKGRIILVENQIFIPTAGGIGVTNDAGAPLAPKTSPWSSMKSICGIGGRVFVGTSTGLLRTTDGGATFTRITTANGLGGNEVQSLFCSDTTLYVKTKEGLAISKDYGSTFVNRTKLADPDVLYNSTFTVDKGRIYAYLAKQGMAVSTDDGQTFTMLSGFDPNIAFANSLAVDGTTIYLSSSGTLYRSSNGGAAELIDPKKYGNPYLSTIKVLNGALWVGTGTNFAVSTDKGETFQVISQPAYDFSSSGGVVYISTYNGVITTSDNGATITKNFYHGGSGSSATPISVYADGSATYVATPSGLHKLR